jgi:hypothetical protein
MAEVIEETPNKEHVIAINAPNEKHKAKNNPVVIISIPKNKRNKNSHKYQIILFTS